MAVKIEKVVVKSVTKSATVPAEDIVPTVLKGLGITDPAAVVSQNEDGSLGVTWTPAPAKPRKAKAKADGAA